MGWVDNLSGNLGLIFTTAHDLVVGDIITIDKDNKTINPSYDGTASVVQVVSANEIKTDVSYGYNPYITATLVPYNSYTQNGGSGLVMGGTTQTTYFNIIGTNVGTTRYRQITINDATMGYPVLGGLYTCEWEVLSGSLPAGAGLYCWAGLNGNFFTPGSRTADFSIPAGTRVS